jgi:hypothetical protein
LCRQEHVAPRRFHDRVATLCLEVVRRLTHLSERATKTILDGPSASN